MTQFPKAFIFDLDGVITDTAEYHYLAWKILAESLGVTIDREFNEQLKGISRIESLERILQLDASLTNMSNEQKEALAAKKNEHYLTLINELQPSAILPGIKQLLDKCVENKMKIALGSASKNAKTIVEKLGVIDYFDYIVDASKVEKGKPDPETFTNAADYLGVPYSACVGLEDAVAGVEAVNSAEMFSVGIGSFEHLNHAHYVVENTAELLFDDIVKQYQKGNVTENRASTTGNVEFAIL